MNESGKKLLEIDELAKKLRNQSEILIIESIAGVGGDVLVRQLLASLIKENQKVFVTTSVKPRKQIINEFLNFDVPKDSIERNLYVITAIQEEASNNNIIPIDMRKVFVISSAIKSCLSFCVAGSLEIVNTLVFLEKREVIQKFLLELIQEARIRNVSLIIPIDIGIWNSGSISFAENLADIIIELQEAVSGFKILRGLRLRKMDNMPPTPFFEYRITEKGITVGDAIE